MSRITKYFNQTSDNLPAILSQDPFVICPASFFEQMGPEQFLATQQIYKVAYEKAWAKVYGDKLNADDFDLGSGI
jgi:hypothetical protein